MEVKDEYLLKEKKEKKINTALTYVMIELVIFCLLLILIVGMLNYFNVIPLSRNNPNFFAFLPHLKISVAPKALEENNTELKTWPISTDNPTVKTAQKMERPTYENQIRYVLEGEVEDVRKEGNSVFITFTNPDVPTFPLMEGAEVVKIVGSLRTPIFSTEVAKNDKIMVVLYYDLSSREWIENKTTFSKQSAEPANIKDN